IPGYAKLSLDLPVAAQPAAADPGAAPVFAAARRQIPVPAPFETRFVTGPRDFRLLIPATALTGLRNPTAMFFPIKDSLIDAVALNAMPCVFPILSLKLLGLASQANGGSRERLSHGLAYTAGVLSSFAALGGALLALRAGGRAVGWGFQLQSPIFVAVLAY